ncbi:MAG: TatD family hydrolase [Clostridium sp.]|nr:TatD family hydrolase [Clostridium sp.]
MIFDTHAHYDDDAFDGDRKELLESIREAGVGAVMNVAANLESCKSTLKLAETYGWIYGAVGVHPSETGELSGEGMEWLKARCSHEKVKAVGEIGLDYYWEEPDHGIQKEWFVRQLSLAREAALPVIIHSRDAAKDTLDIMKGEKAGDMGGVIHCFSYGKEIAREYLNMGFFLGIGGVVTFNNAKKLKEVVEYAPLESIVLETDCPYLAPAPNRGKRNSSLNLGYVAEAVGRIKGVDRQKVIEVTWENGLKLYGLQGLG